MRNYKYFFLALLFACTSEQAKTHEVQTEKTPFVETKDSVLAKEKEKDLVLEVQEVDSSALLKEAEKKTEIETISAEASDEKPSADETTTNSAEVEQQKNEEPEPEPLLRPNYAAYDALLKKYVSKQGNVDYSSFQKEQAKLEVFIAHLEKNQPETDWSKNEKLAYWINLYNALTLQLIIENYPTKSIKNINNGKPWDLKVTTIENRSLSLNEIENDIIRPRFKEPRIHFALNCGAASCPKLLNGAFFSQNLDNTLTRMTKEFLANKEKNEITESQVEISKIFEWYAADFGKIHAFLSKYAGVHLSDETPLSFKEYNWDLNE